MLFWHFWGGRDRPVVEGVVQRFNDSQRRYRVRALAMPGNNLDLKFFLSVAGGDPPDLVNQDDPIIADWASRGALTPLDALAPAAEVDAVGQWLYPVARELASYDGRLYALPNGLDVRALYYNKTWLDELGIDPPRTLEELDALAEAVAPAGASTLERVGFLPNPKRFWEWSIVFGGRFADQQAAAPAGLVTADCRENLAALRWMAAYSRRYGADRVASFRSGDQALTGSSFPLLAGRRYAAIMDGQWRVRDIAEARASARAAGKPFDEYGVVPLPPPVGGRRLAGRVKGNFFIVPRGARQAAGAWAFMKFWAGFGGRADANAAEAARACAAGGWIPVSQFVTDRPEFQAFLSERPLFGDFVRLAASKNQRATPSLPVASFYDREMGAAAQDVMYRGADPLARLELAAERVRRRVRAATARRDEDVRTNP
ncbi:MAG: extracellular solute-binding protein [Planctomycetota bacterium]